MKNIFKSICTAALLAATGWPLTNFKGGYTATLGELGERYRGGVGGIIELEIPLPGPVAAVPMGGLAQLGEDQLFTDLLWNYIDQYWPPGVPLPPELQQLGEINSSMYFFGAGLRLYATENAAVKIYAEGGLGYYYRDLDAQGVPLSAIAAYIPEMAAFADAIKPVSGVGMHADAGLEILPVSPVALQIGGRFIHAFGIGRTRVDDFMEANEFPGFTPPETEDVDLFFAYAGLGIF